MAVFGKIVGGTIGLFLGGPFGAFAGAVFGHRYDRRRDDPSSRLGFADVHANYTVLGCSPADPDEHIKKQYRKLVFACHPDIISTKELPGESVRLLTEKFIEIQKAYEFVKHHRGWEQHSIQPPETGGENG